MFGQAIHAPMNELINQLAERRSVMVASHGGVAVGSAAPNTALAVQGALASGADFVKIDVAASNDGVFYAFHDGFEEELLDLRGRNIQALSSHEIGGLRYHWVDRPGRRAVVEQLVALLTQFKDREVVFALDRSWWRWPALLRVLDGLNMPHQILLKVPAREEKALAQLASHRTKYAVLPICGDLEEMRSVVGRPELNTVGVELIAHSTEDEWCQPGMIEQVHGLGILTWANSMTLTTGIPLFGPYDDERALIEGPAAGWGPLMDLGFDVIQTQWPWLLAQYRDSRG